MLSPPDDEPKLQDWCNDYAVLLVRIDNLPARGFLVNDTIIIEAEVSLGKTVSEAATGEENPIEIDQPREAILSSKTQDLLVSRLHNALRNLRTILVKEAGDGLGAGHIFLDSAMQRISKRIPRSKEELLEIEGITKAKVNKYGDRLLQTIEATVCDYYKTKQSGNSTGDSAKIKRNEGSRTKKIKPIQAINESLAEPLSTETQEPGISKGVDDPKVMHPGGEDHSKGNMGSTRLSKKVARTSNITSPCSSSVQLTSKNLLVQLSTVASNCKSTSVSCDGSALLQQQREELAKFFKMSLEAICEANWFVKVQEVVLKISEFTTDPLEKTVVQDLLSRLVEFGNNIPQALSTIESCRSVETCSAQTVDKPITLNGSP
ncbi:ATP-dependent DNA helicase Q-like 4A [Linum grandiflorum]